LRAINWCADLQAVRIRAIYEVLACRFALGIQIEAVA